MKICIDAGHGGKSSGAAGKYRLEKNINLELSLKLREKLIKSGIDIVMTRDSDTFLSLQERCDVANKGKCDFFISIHCNSFSDPSASGVETYYYKGSDKEYKLASAIQKAAVDYSKSKDRGIKTSDFYVIKHTNMPAILFETEFISNIEKENLLNDGAWQDGLTKTIAIAVCNTLGIIPNVDEVLYRVLHDGTQTGAFKEKDNALQMAEEILAEVTSGNVKVISSDGETVLDKTKEPEIPGSTQPPELGAYHLMSSFKSANASQMESFVHRINPDAPYLAKKYLAAGMEEGIRGDIAFAQALKETNYFRFTGNVKPEQNNFAGIGSTGEGIRGASFLTVDDGVLAHIQHLKAYANTEPLNTKLIDPRFNLVKRGSAPNFEDLNGKWSVPGDGYGQSIINIWRRIMDEEVPEGMKIEDDTNPVSISAEPASKSPSGYQVIANAVVGLIEKFKNIINNKGGSSV